MIYINVNCLAFCKYIFFCCTAEDDVASQVQNDQHPEDINHHKPGKRPQKKHGCLYCETLFTNLPRHFASDHPNEIDFAMALSFPKFSTMRLRAWAQLTAKGKIQYFQNRPRQWWEEIGTKVQTKKFNMRSERHIYRWNVAKDSII